MADSTLVALLRAAAALGAMGLMFWLLDSFPALLFGSVLVVAAVAGAVSTLKKRRRARQT